MAVSRATIGRLMLDQRGPVRSKRTPRPAAPPALSATGPVRPPPLRPLDPVEMLEEAVSGRPGVDLIEIAARLAIHRLGRVLARVSAAGDEGDGPEAPAIEPETSADGVEVMLFVRELLVDLVAHVTPVEPATSATE